MDEPLPTREQCELLGCHDVDVGLDPDQDSETDWETITTDDDHPTYHSDADTSEAEVSTKLLGFQLTCKTVFQ